jgi:hypothetical protein
LKNGVIWEAIGQQSARIGRQFVVVGSIGTDFILKI